MTTTGATSEHLTDLIDGWLSAHLGDLVGLRRDLHAHPELSGEEHRTTSIVRGELDRAGHRHRTMSVGTGLIADTAPRPGATAPRIALRADLDALAMTDLKTASYRSTVDGVSHSCGHDVHTTITVGVARFLGDHPDVAQGPVRFIFQPAEERVPGGALDVLADGGLADVDAVVAFHCEPKIDVGRIALRSGAITSAADMVTITLHGPGGHTARPELTIDTITAAADIVARVPDLVAASVADDAQGEPVKLVFGAIHGGDAANAIPTSVELRASVRTPSLAAWELLEANVRAQVATVAAEHGAEAVVDYVRGVPPTVNDATVVERVRAVAGSILGEDCIDEAPQSWGGDDFAWLTRATRGAYVRLGVHAPGGPRRDLHVGEFDVDEDAIGVGIRLLVALVAAPVGEDAR